MAATATWMREERASIWWRTKRLLSPKDEIRRRMTGVTATDPGDGSASLLFDARWAIGPLTRSTRIEIPSILLPPVKASSAVAGEITPDAATNSVSRRNSGGYRDGDAPSGLLGAGIVDPATMLLSLSTGAQVMVPDDPSIPILPAARTPFAPRWSRGLHVRGGTRWGPPSSPAWRCAGYATRCYNFRWDSRGRTNDRMGAFAAHPVIRS